MKYIMIKRLWMQRSSILGQLLLYDSLDFKKPLFSCATLENASKAIPEGDYFTTISSSRKFKRLLPELHRVKGRVGIRIHHGNYYSDSSGCILVGRSPEFDNAFKGNYYIEHSCVTLENLLSLLGSDYIVTSISNHYEFQL